MKPQPESSIDIPELPTLDAGITLLNTGESRPLVPLQTLAVDRVLLDGGTGIWVGTGRHCATNSLTDIAPSRRILDRIKIARGFTPYQHTTLLQNLENEITKDTAIVVIPELDAHYRSDDVQGDDGRDMLVRALASVVRVARKHQVPVLTTRSSADAFAEPIEAASDHLIEFRDTPMGPQFVGEDFETLVYPLSDGWVQTTWAFWRDILEARRPLHAAAGVTQEVSIGGAH